MRQTSSPPSLAASMPAILPGGAPPELVKEMGLRYVSDSKPGIRRERGEDGEFQYFDAHGQPIDDEKTLARIKSLGIPPAYADVWICPSDNGYLQATGRDAKGRKQARYHPRWRETRDQNKYEHMMAFGDALPKIRKRVEKDLSHPGLPREKVLATVTRLLETTLIRIGNKEYAKDHYHYGLTTLHNRHVDVEGTTVHFHFRGKSGKEHAIDLRDRKLAGIVKRLRDLPGYELFQYEDENGELQTIQSEDVNAYLREITGQDFTAKDFRTWAGTVLAALTLQEFERFNTETQAKKNVVQAIKTVSQRLGNTPAICRRCYVHPAVLDSYLDGTMLQSLEQRAEQALVESLHSLQPEEAAVMALLQQRLAREQEKNLSRLA